MPDAAARTLETADDAKSGERGEDRGAVVAQLSGVTVRRGRKLLLDGIDWTIREGERWVVLGPNGAGKTTLVQLLAARMHPTFGAVHLFDEKIGRVDLSELRPLIGLASAALGVMVPPTETALDLVVTAGYDRIGRWNEEYEADDLDRARLLLESFGVLHLADRTLGTLSSGERQRVMVARALMTDPELLLLDEPGAGLDLGGREELLGSLRELALDPATPVTVLVTHHVEEIPEGFTHVLLVHEGRIAAAGPIAKTLNDPNLSRTFGLLLEATHEDGRWRARAR